MSSSSSMWLNKIAWIGEYMWCDKEQDEDEYLSIYDDEWDKVLENDTNQNLYVIAFLFWFLSIKFSSKAVRTLQNLNQKIMIKPKVFSLTAAAGLCKNVSKQPTQFHNEMWHRTN